MHDALLYNNAICSADTPCSYMEMISDRYLADTTISCMVLQAYTGSLPTFPEFNVLPESGNSITLSGWLRESIPSHRCPLQASPTHMALMAGVRASAAFDVRSSYLHLSIYGGIPRPNSALPQHVLLLCWTCSDWQRATDCMMSLSSPTPI